MLALVWSSAERFVLRSQLQMSLLLFVPSFDFWGFFSGKILPLHYVVFVFLLVFFFGFSFQFSFWRLHQVLSFFLSFVLFLSKSFELFFYLYQDISFCVLFVHYLLVLMLFVFCNFRESFPPVATRTLLEVDNSPFFTLQIGVSKLRIISVIG